MNSKRKIAYFLGNIDMSGGGTAPYALRMFDCLVNSVDADYLLVAPNLSVIDALPKEYRIFDFFVPKSVWYDAYAQQLFGMGAFASNKLLSVVKNLNHWQLQLLKMGVTHFHCPYQVPPYFQWSIPLIVTMHDVQELHFPEFFTPRERASRALYYWKSLEFASKVIVSYEHVKEDLIRYFSLPTEKVVVCPHPISLDWVEKSNEQKIRQVLDKYNLLSQQFILYPAQTWKHKNHLALVKAIALLKPDIDVPKIVCTGKKNNFFTEIEQEIIANQLDDKFLFLDIIPEEELNCLYQACKFVIIPTLYEAGSFPLIESILHGVPVICSDVTSLPQTIGDIRFCFSPHRPIEIADMIGKMLQDANFYTMNKKNSEQRKHELISEKFMTMEKLKFLYQILDEETKRHS